ncbi:MAG: response regulator [Bauldia sp.]|nr:response regulator [Bauldia sp.]
MLTSEGLMSRALNLLVADDDPASREMVQAALSAYGYNIDTAGDGLTAWNIVQEHVVDLAIVDLNMPELSGYDFIARCRVNDDLMRLPIIVMSAATEDEVAERAFGLGATGYVHKPISWPILSHQVWYVLHNEARAAELRALKARIGITAPLPIELAH